MNIDAIELTVTETVETEEAFDLLALSMDDLDMVGGGAQIGTCL